MPDRSRRAPRGRTARILPVWVASVLACPQGLPAADFLRGDVDGSGRLAVSDAIRILAHLFQGDVAAVPCADAADADDSGAIDLADAIHLLSGLFLGGPAPAAPFPACGADPIEDALGCEEACPPPSVYFGKEFRADGLFIVIDRSGSMQHNGELTRAKRETEQLIQDLLPGMQFGLVFFDLGIVVFPAQGGPADATDEMKALGVASVRNTPPGNSSCGLKGLLLALESARRSRSRNPAVLYVSDGGGTCQGANEDGYLRKVLDTVTAANRRHARIHTFQVDPGSDLRDDFLELLALQNGGTYTELP